MVDVEQELGKAVRYFWKTRFSQKKQQGAGTGRKDAGNRAAVTGGKHADGFVNLVAAIVHDGGLFGNNFNNRVEEALGNATDLWTAYGEGVFKPSQKPWLGYFFMLEEHEKSVRPTQRINLNPFKVDEAFQQLSYAKRYELVCERLVRERLYDAACFFTSNAKSGIRGVYAQPTAKSWASATLPSRFTHERGRLRRWAGEK